MPSCSAFICWRWLGLVALPALDVGVVGQAAEHRERVIDVARQIVLRQRRIAAARGRNPDLLGSPVEIEPDLVGRKLHERAHAGVGVEQALGLRIAAGRGAERKQARPVATVAADRNPGAHDDAEAVAQRMQPLDRRVYAVHHAERVAVELERAGVQSRPFRDAGSDASQCANRSLLHSPSGE